MSGFRQNHICDCQEDGFRLHALKLQWKGKANKATKRSATMSEQNNEWTAMSTVCSENIRWPTAILNSGLEFF